MKYSLREEAAAEIRKHARERGFAHARAMCPKCVRETLNGDSSEEIQLDMSIEEYLVESVREKPQWRLVLEGKRED